VRVALDTNILAYAEGVNGEDMQRAALDLLRRLPPTAAIIPVQVLGELFNVLVRKGGSPRDKARAAILDWRDSFPLIETSAAVVFAAADLATDHRLSIWDSVILAAAAAGGCRLLLSQDLQDGFTWSGVTVTDPFSPSHHPVLAAILAEQ
jgi:predicted nucleic acid-binding protein